MAMANKNFVIDCLSSTKIYAVPVPMAVLEIRVHVNKEQNFGTRVRCAGKMKNIASKLVIFNG